MNRVWGLSGSPSFDEATLRFLQQVFQWVRAGDALALAPVLAERLPPNLCNEQGDSLLILAAYHGHGEVVQLLLAAGADTEIVNERGQTALAAAAFRGDSGIVQALLRHGAQVDSPPGGRTAFMIAAMFNRVEIMRVLRAQGADVWSCDATGLSALQAARTMGADDAEDLLRQWSAAAQREA